MIRSLLKHFIINSVSLYLISLTIYGIFFYGGVKTIILAGVALTLVALIIKPVINVLLLPVNLVTFGLFRWVGYTVALYIVTLIVPGFKLSEFIFNGFNSYLVVIPAFSLSGIFAFILFSFVISLTSSILYWIFK